MESLRSICLAENRAARRMKESNLGIKEMVKRESGKVCVCVCVCGCLFITDLIIEH